MPFNLSDQPIKNLPKNFSSKQKRVATSAANSALASGKSDGEAIAIGISAGKKISKSVHMDSIEKNDMISIFSKLLKMLSNSEHEDEDDEVEKYLNSSKSNNNDPNKPTSIEVVKQFEDEEMIAIEPLYINVGKADTQGDGVTDESIDQLIDNFNENIKNIQGNIHHEFMTDGFFPLKAYRLPMNVYVGDPSDPTNMVLIEEGQPVVKMQFTNKDFWEKRKSGVFGGVSIGAMAKRIPNPDFKGSEEE